MENKNSYAIAVVVDQNFGNKLIALTKRLPTWICSSSINVDVINELGFSNENKFDITKFNYDRNDSPEDMFLKILNTVDLHHGEHSHTPAWSTMEVYGIKKLTNRIISSLKEYGEGAIKEIPAGFIFQR